MHFFERSRIKSSIFCFILIIVGIRFVKISCLKIDNQFYSKSSIFKLNICLIISRRYFESEYRQIWPMTNLTHSVAEGRLDDFRLSELSKAQISRIEFLEPKWPYPSKRIFHYMNLSDYPLKLFRSREKLFLTGQKIEFMGAVKV